MLLVGPPPSIHAQYSLPHLPYLPWKHQLSPGVQSTEAEQADLEVLYFLTHHPLLDGLEQAESNGHFPLLPMNIESSMLSICDPYDLVCTVQNIG